MLLSKGDPTVLVTHPISGCCCSLPRCLQGSTSSLFWSLVSASPGAELRPLPCQHYFSVYSVGCSAARAFPSIALAWQEPPRHPPIGLQRFMSCADAARLISCPYDVSMKKQITAMAIDHVEGPQPTSTPLERDARLVSTDHKVAPSEIAIGVIIGRAAEYFDFFVFAIASVVVFPKVFFPFAEPVTATLYSFAMFSLAFVARPIGSIIFTAVDRRHGRGVKLTIALFLLGFSTMAISFLPGYAQIGAWSLYLLGILRVGQGLALGGAWDGLASLLALNAPIERRGFYAAIPQLGAPLGFMVAGVLFAFFLLNLSEADFLDWGWRYPFFCAFAVNVVALFSRLAARRHRGVRAPS